MTIEVLAKFVFMTAALLVACDSGDDSKIDVPLPDADYTDITIPDPGYFCSVCKMYNGCNPKADATVSAGDGSIDIHMTCQEIGACGSTCADSGAHK